ncbi:hypothetical protein [Candidatus Manganitrophus noduliformans]|uniref:Uncharacterized protein n=1 Tax=Candidatus Manganitrophus noduliformans TaxID=2606439 RepID=A0A7X6ID94_9BACT|nr:hypothetical protein [Candidatus Manganitrophus noduliformans]NKE73371.1 hypothetical protein [Candidatus Manganitrophus noduliformans]
MKKFDSVNQYTNLYTAYDFLFGLGVDRKIFDITNRTDPSFLGTFSLPSDGYREELCLAYQNWIFFNAGYQGIYLLNVGDPSQALTTKFLPGTLKIGLFKDEFLIGSFQGLGARVYKIDKLPNTVQVGQIPGADSLFDFFFYKDHLFVACREEGFKVFDLSNLEKPRLVSQFFKDSLCFALEHYHEEIALFKIESGTIFVMDISHPAKPRKVAEIKVNLQPYKNFFVDYPYLIVCLREKERFFNVYDCSDPSRPRLVYTYSSPDLNYYTHQGHLIVAWGLAEEVDQQGKIIELSQLSQPFEVLQVISRGEIQKLASFQKTERIHSVAIKANHIYIAKNDGLFVMSVLENK